MRKTLLSVFLLVTILGLAWTSSLVTADGNHGTFNSENYERAFTFTVPHSHFQSTHTLYTSVPATLYDYYNGRNPILDGDAEYARYVTVDAFKLIAEGIRNATQDPRYGDEQFADAVLSLVRQIDYVKSSVKYPVEAMVENVGDCDVLSLLAASIMKAGGLDVVLLYYRDVDPSHMNVGVYLPYKPVYRTWWMVPTGFEYNNKTYWMAETTSRGYWKVGDRPDMLAYSTPHVIPLNSTAKYSPAQVSASLNKPLVPSQISITVSSDNDSFTEGNRLLNITGGISPMLSEKKVTMYISQKGLPTKTLQTDTDEQGNYKFIWNLNSTGIYHIRTSWGGSTEYAGADSESLTVLVSEKPLDPQGLLGNWQEMAARAYANPLPPFMGQGAKELLESSNVTGTGVSISGEFIILGDNQTKPPQNETITRRTVYLVRNPRTRMVSTVVMEEQIPVEPENPIKQLGLILQEDSTNNYTASLKVLGDQDMTQITQSVEENSTAFMNTSEITRENTWYKLEATISDNATNAKLFEQNGTLVKDIDHQNPAVSVSRVGILMTYEPGQVVAFKNLKVKTLEQQQPVETSPNEGRTANVPDWLLMYVVPLMVLIPAFAGVSYALRRRKRSKTETNAQS